MFNALFGYKKKIGFFKKNIKKINYNNINFYNYIIFIENGHFKIYESKYLYFKEIYFRCKADLENLKRKMSEEISKSYKYSVEDFSESLLPVIDSLESTLSTNFCNSEGILEGIRLTLKIFTNSLINKDIGFILPDVGEIFNPHKHLAVSVISCKDKINNSIANVLQKGYYIFERILRPALVVVNKVE
ncbi:MAG: nucleotide exchange factor GrpE [Candidatus Nasuia deltocephalinicola]